MSSDSEYKVAIEVANMVASKGVNKVAFKGAACVKMYYNIN